MIIKFDREPQPQSVSEPANTNFKPDDTPGLRGERIVGEFLHEAFGEIFTKMERTPPDSRDDKNGIDYVVELAGNGRFAIDITFDKRGSERRRKKEESFLRNPCIPLHDEQNKAISEPLPRLLIDGGQSLNLWFVYEDERNKKYEQYKEEAERRGLKLTNFMSVKAKNDKMRYFLTQILDQVKGMSMQDREYREKTREALKIFGAEAKKLGIPH